MRGKVRNERSAVDGLVAEVAARQHGVVARAQLLALGLSAEAINRRVQSGRLHRVHRGVYLVGHTAARRRAHEMAAVLACGPGAVISHRSAALLWSVLPYRPPTPVHISLPPERDASRHGICVHRTSRLEPRDIRRLDGIPVTGPARTLLDLASLVSPVDLERAAAEARVRKLADHHDLVDQLDRNPHRPGTGRLRRLVASHAPAAYTRSKAERMMLALIRKARIPEPETNVRIRGHEVDFLWRDARLIVEVDGSAYHSDHAAFERDRDRSNELQLHGYTVLRITWQALTRQSGAVTARIRRALRPR